LTSTQIEYKHKPFTPWASSIPELEDTDVQCDAAGNGKDVVVYTLRQSVAAPD